MKYFFIILFIVLLSFPSTLYSQGRESISINDNWEFVFSELPLEELSRLDILSQMVNIPHTWNNTDIQSGEKVDYTTAWYIKRFELAEEYNGKQAFIRFEGVGQYAEVYVNGKYAGDHLGSYSAFAFNITRLLKADTVNTIHVKVNNELNYSYPKDNFLFGIYGGIYRDVSLIFTSNIHIGITDHASGGVYIHPKEVGDEIAVLKIVTLVNNELSTKQNLLVENTLLDGETVVAKSSKEEGFFPGGLQQSVSILEIKDPRLWNGKKDPFLYTLRTRIIQDGKIMDEISQPYGIRYFEIDPDKGFILNGEAYRLYGVCRHQEWQDLGNALLPSHHRQDMEMINEIGATSIRLTHYQQAEYIYDLADSLGILVWAEIPFVNGYKEGADGNAIQQMTELIKQNFNHPSIFVWGVHNEVIKGGVVQQPVKLTSELHNLSKDLDPHRYTVAVSNIWWVHDHPIHELCDLQGFNQYTGWYGGKPHELGNWINNYHQNKPDVRFSVSEYGAGGNIFQQSSDLSVPNPTGQFFPEAYQTHYHETTWLAIESSPFIWASYVWNMFDFSVPEWDRGGIKGRNHKGLITYDRQVKKDAYYWYRANWSDEDVFHLCGKRHTEIHSDTLSIKAYCNFATPVLFMNGERIGPMKPGINEVQYIKILDGVPAGTYEIEIRALKNEMLYREVFELDILY
jgi:beta-galactosidase